MCGIAGLIGWTGTENQISDIIKISIIPSSMRA